MRVVRLTAENFKRLTAVDITPDGDVVIAMAGNPELRVIRVADGSLLDGDAMTVIGEMAADHDFQVWVERVDETGQVGVVIEDGAVAAPKEDEK